MTNLRNPDFVNLPYRPSETDVPNGLDTRVGSTTNSVTRTFLRDGAYVTDPVLADGAAFYTPGVSERRGGVTTFLHSGLKNADAQSTASGLSAARQYDAFGNLLSSSGSWQGPFGYAGAFGYQEDATGLMLLGHRLYDPSTGRFLTRDPIQDGRNWYVYCGNDPVTYVDPDGKTRRAVVILAVVRLIDWIGGASATDPPFVMDGRGTPPKVGRSVDPKPRKEGGAPPPPEPDPLDGKVTLKPQPKPGTPRPGTPPPRGGGLGGSGGGVGAFGPVAVGLVALPEGLGVVINHRRRYDDHFRDLLDGTDYAFTRWEGVTE
jgi:RHS repeat-associated protein